MDLDKELVCAIVREGKDAFAEVLNQGIDPDEYLFGDGKEAFLFVGEYYREYGDVPSLEVVQAKLNKPIESQQSEPFAFFWSEIRNRRLWRVQREGIDLVKESLEKRDPKGAAEAWTEIHRKIQKESLTVRRVESLLALGRQVLLEYEDAKAGKRGIPTPWPTMDEQTLGWWPEDLVIIVGRLGVGKCLESLTLIQDPKTGVQRTIEEVYRNPDLSMVTTWGKDRAIHPAEITAKVDTGYKECFRFTLGTGRTVDVTPEHPFLTPMGWKRADEIEPGGSVAIPASMPFALAPTPMHGAEVDLLAILLADGSLTHGNVEFTKADREVVRIASEAAEELGAEVVLRNGSEDTYGIRCEDQHLNPVTTMLRKQGVHGKKSVDKAIPDDIFKLPKDQLARFLTVFWMCDGYVDSNGPEMVLGSRKMLEQVQSLLLRFGIQSKLSDKLSKCNGKTFAAWRLRVYSFCHETFLKEFDLWGDKRAALERVAAKSRNSNVGFPRLSKEMRAEIEKLSRARIGRWQGGLLKEVGIRLGWSSKFMTRSLFGQHDSLLLSRFKVFCEVYGCEDEYRWLYDSGLFWDTVESVESVGEQKIYDLTVEPTSCYVANDVLVHNTWTLVQCAHKAWSAGRKVLVISTEMNVSQMARRFFALHLRLPYGEMRTGKLGEFVESKLYAGVKEMLEEDGINIVAGDFDYSIDNLSALVTDEKPELLCVDGPYLIKNTGKDRHERVSNNFDDFKKIGKRTGAAVLTNLQFNRSAKTGQAQTVVAENIGITDVAGWNCLPADSMIATSGGYRKISDLVSASFEVMTPSGLRPAVAVATGEKSQNIVTLADGSTFTSSHDHRLWTFRGDSASPRWVRSGDIRPGDLLMRAVSLEIGAREISDGVAELIGVAIGDGWIARDNCWQIAFDGRDLDSRTKIAKTIKDEFGYEPKLKAKGQHGGITCDQLHLNSVKIIRELRRFGVGRELSADKKVPSGIFESDIAVRCAFLRGLFDADGSVEESGSITLSTVSESLARGVHMLLWSVGVGCTTRTASINQARDGGYRIRVNGEEANRYMDRIGFMSSRKSDEARARLAARHKRNTASFGRPWLGGEHWVWVPVVSMEDAPSSVHMFDISVTTDDESERCFVADGLLVHNSNAAYGLIQTEEQREQLKLSVKALKIREGEPGTFEINWNHQAMDFSEVDAGQPTGADYNPGAPSGADAQFAEDDESYDDVPF